MEKVVKVQAQIHEPKTKDPTYADLHKTFLERSSMRWLRALQNVGKEIGIRCDTEILGSPSHEKPADLLIHSHYELDPHVSQDILHATQERHFRLLLLLSYKDVPRADWTNDLSHGLLPRQKKSDELTIPTREMITFESQRLRLQAMASFGRQEMVRLLEFFRQKESLN